MKTVSDQVNILPYFPNEKAKVDKSLPINILPVNQPNLEDDKFFNASNGTIGSKLVYEALSVSLTRFSAQANQFKSVEVAENSAKTELFFDFNQVANNVLNFVGGRLQAAKAQGAGDEKIANLFQQARDGVEQGFAAATEELDEIGMLNDELEEGINKSRNLIDQGINNLEKNLRPEADQPSNKVESFVSASYSASGFSAQENTSSLSITTADGDVVTISFNDYLENSQNQQFNYAASYDAQGSSTQYNYSYGQTSYRETNFSYSIEGSLDDAEKQAIGELLKGISKIENDFFSGNLDKALEKALTLGFDQNELSGFNLELRQTTTAVASQRYNEMAQLAKPSGGDLVKLTQPLFDFAEQYQVINKQATALLANKESAFEGLINAVFKAEFGQQQEMLSRLDNFLKKFPS